MASVVIAVCVLVVALAILSKTVSCWWPYLAMLQGIAGAVEQMKLQAIGKMMIATFQILGNISAVLKIKLPESFTGTIMGFVDWFRFDIVSMFSLGCLSSGSYASSLATNVMFVVVLVIVLGLVYLYDVRKSAKSLKMIDARDDNVKKHLQGLFGQFASDGEAITLTEMQAIAHEINPDASPESVLAIFESADGDGSGSIDFAEFHAAFVKSVADNDNTLDMTKLVERTNRANIGADAAGRMFLLIFLMYLLQIWIIWLCMYT